MGNVCFSFGYGLCTCGQSLCDCDSSKRNADDTAVMEAFARMNTVDALESGDKKKKNMNNKNLSSLHSTPRTEWIYPHFQQSRSTRFPRLFDDDELDVRGVRALVEFSSQSSV